MALISNSGRVLGPSETISLGLYGGRGLVFCPIPYFVDIPGNCASIFLAECVSEGPRFILFLSLCGIDILNAEEIHLLSNAFHKVKSHFLLSF